MIKSAACSSTEQALSGSSFLQVMHGLSVNCRSERCQEIRGGHLLQIFLAQKEVDIFGTKLGSTT